MINLENRTGSSQIHRVKNYINDASLIFEIGAFNGNDVNTILNTWNNCKIHCFEPDPEAFEQLSKYNSDNVICNNIALSNVNGQVKFNKYFDTRLTEQSERSDWYKTCQSLLKIHPNHIGNNPHQEVVIDVKCSTINDYCKINNIIPDILLIDTQGSEWEILDGASDILSHVKCIMTEFSTHELYEEQKFLNDIIDLLSKYNFDIIEKIDICGDYHGDAIFIKKTID